MTDKTSQTTQTATGQTIQPAQAMQTTNTGTTTGSTVTTGSTTGVTAGTTTEATIQPTQATQSTNIGNTSTTTGSTTTDQPTQATDAAQPIQSTNTSTTGSTTSTTTDQPAQATETASFVPAWQVKSDKLKKAVQQGYGVQVVYKSTNEEPCEPTLVTERQASDNYPFVVEEPAGFIAPKFLWNGTTRGWIETASIQQGKVLAEVQNKIAELQQQVTDFGKTAGQVDNVNKQVQADEAEFTNAITALKQSSQENSSAIQTQLGQLITMISSMAVANKSETQTTAQTTSSQPAQATTANTATNANTTTSTGSTQPTTAQSTNA